MEKYEIIHGDKKIEFNLIRKNVKNINLNVKPNMTVEISAGKHIPLDDLKKFVKRKATWILKNIEYFKKSQSEQKFDREYINGETYKYLGRQYRLKVVESVSEGIICQKGFLILKIKDKSNIKRKENILSNWYRSRAEIIFNEVLNNIYISLEKYKIQKPKIQIRSMKARWGSCIEKKGIILLNFDLIDAPKFCIEYVILHELIHFKYRNHDIKFYDLITALMPDWERRKDILDKEIVKNL